MSWALCDWLALADFEQRRLATTAYEPSSLLFSTEPFFTPLGDWFLGLWPRASALLLVAPAASLLGGGPTSLVGALALDLGAPSLTGRRALAGFLAKRAAAFQPLTPFVAWLTPADSLTALPVTLLDPLSFFREFDVALIGLELCLAVAVLGALSRFSSLLRANRLFYDDLVTFSVANNISLTELGTLFSLVGGFILLDLFLSVSEEDLADTASYGLLLLVLGLFFFLLLAVDVQYLYMVSSVSSGDLTIRTVVSDITNNFLCALRIFFCWVRYVFYDLQVEFIDFSFHYTDTSNDLLLAALFETTAEGGQWGARAQGAGVGGFWDSLKLLLFGVLFVLSDVALFLLQVLIGLFKLFIAFFLLWLIVDLFILKAFALSESRALLARRAVA